MTRSPTRQNGLAIRRMRRERGIRTGDLAKKVRVHRDALCHIEGGRQQAGWELLSLIATALDVPRDALLTDHGREELAVSA